MKPKNHKKSFVAITILSLFIFLMSLLLTIGLEKSELAESTNRVIEIPSH